MRSTRIAYGVKYLLYVVIFLILFALQTTPRLFEIMGVKPVLLIPAALALAVVEGEGVGAAFGAVAGLYCDLASGALFGFFAILSVILCVCAALLTANLVQKNFKTLLLIGISALLITQSLYFYFYYALWGYENSSLIFWSDIFPCAIYSGVLTVIFFVFFRRFSPWLTGKLKITEKNN